MATAENYRDRLVAHRGYQKLYPENTLLAHQKAIDAGALFLETDIQLSADMQAVLYHEASLKRVSGRRGKTNEIDLAKLLQISAHEPRRLGRRFIDEKITPLSSFVQLLRNNSHVTAYIEIKKEAINFAGFDKAYTAITGYLSPIAAQCYLFSYDYDFMKYVRDKGWELCGVILKKWRDLETPVVQSIRPDTIFCSYKKVPNNIRLNKIKSEIVLFEIADPLLATHWFNRGASKIETFDIGNMITKSGVYSRL